MDLMAAGLWVPGRSHELVAAQFEVAPATVKDWATSASRILRLAVEEDAEGLRARLTATLDTIVSRALSADKPDYRAAVSAVDTHARLLGLVVQKHEVAMTEEQARAKYRELTGQDWPATPRGSPHEPPDQDRSAP